MPGFFISTAPPDDECVEQTLGLDVALWTGSWVSVRHR